MNICGQIQGKSIELDLIKNLYVLLQLDTFINYLNYFGYCFMGPRSL